MSDEVEFYFDFSSPYGYIAAMKIDKVAARFGRGVIWKPILLGAAMQQTGNKPLVDQPLKGDYVRRDFVRMAKLWDIPFQQPEPFPIATIATGRGYYWIADQNMGKAVDYAKGCMLAYYRDGKNISKPEVCAEVASSVGFEAETFLAALQDEAVKNRFKEEVGSALEKGVFGSPFFIVDGEQFWGADRLWMLEEWLKTGGW